MTSKPEKKEQPKILLILKITVSVVTLLLQDRKMLNFVAKLFITVSLSDQITIKESVSIN